VPVDGAFGQLEPNGDLFQVRAGEAESREVGGGRVEQLLAGDDRPLPSAFSHALAPSAVKKYVRRRILLATPPPPYSRG
jgi:hypothetical protein